MKLPVFPNGTVFTHGDVELVVHEYDVNESETCRECYAYGPNIGPGAYHKCMGMPTGCTDSERNGTTAQFIELKRYTMLRFKGKLP